MKKNWLNDRGTGHAPPIQFVCSIEKYIFGSGHMSNIERERIRQSLACPISRHVNKLEWSSGIGCRFDGESKKSHSTEMYRSAGEIWLRRCNIIDRSICLLYSSQSRHSFTINVHPFGHSINKHFSFFCSLLLPASKSLFRSRWLLVWKLARVVAHYQRCCILINYSILFWTDSGGASSLINSIINWSLYLAHSSKF